MAKSIKILHLSDIHFSSTTLDPCLSQLLEVIKKHKNKFRGKIDFVVVSGDIAQRGLTEQFNACRDFFFKPLNELLNFSDFSKYLFICGNHDILRDQLRDDLKSFIKDYLEGHDNISESDLEDILSDNKNFSEYYYVGDVISDLRFACKQACDLTFERIEYRAQKFLNNYFKKSLAPYIKFVSTLEGYKPYKNVITEKYPDHWSKWLFGRRFESLNGGQKINFFGFNSSWFCVGKDNGNLFLLHELVGFPKTKKRYKNISISLLHHPPSWLQWSERNADIGIPAFGKILDLSDMILVGHEHDRHVQAPSYYGSQTLLVSSGSTLEKDVRHPNNIKVLQLHLKENEPDKIDYLSYDTLIYNPNVAVSDEKKWTFDEGEKGFPFEMPTVTVEYSDRDFWSGESVLMNDEVITEKDRRKFVVKNYIEGFARNDTTLENLSHDHDIYQLEESAASNSRTIFMPFDLVEFKKRQEVLRFDLLYELVQAKKSFVVLLPYHILRRDSKVKKILEEHMGDVFRKFNLRDDIHISEPLFITNSEVSDETLMMIPQKLIDKEVKTPHSRNTFKESA